MGQSVGPNSVRPWTSAAGPYIVFTAREQVAELIGAPSRDVIFTSCATESNNTAIAAALRATGILPVKGPTQTRAGRPWHTKRHIVTSQVEHSSVLNFCMALERGECSDGPRPPRVDLRSTLQDVARASRPLSREPPAPAPRGQDAHATAGETPAVQESAYRVTYLPVDREGLLFNLV